MTLIPLELDHAWVIFTDGLSNIQGSDVDIILENNFGLVEEVSLRSKFWTTNNQVEFEAVSLGITLDKEVGVEHMKLRTDSQLVVSRIRGEAQAKDPIL